jgi:hypothetical protein
MQMKVENGLSISNGSIDHQFLNYYYHRKASWFASGPSLLFFRVREFLDELRSSKLDLSGPKCWGTTGGA